MLNPCLRTVQRECGFRVNVVVGLGGVATGDCQPTTLLTTDSFLKGHLSSVPLWLSEVLCED